MPSESTAPPAGERGGRPIAAVRELIRLIVKALKALRLYDSKNAVSERLETELYERLSLFVSGEGSLDLTIQESQLRCDDEVVFESGDRNDSLAFLLYRDGIRRLSFDRGLELAELHSFLRCLNRVGLLANDQDDLVTLLWEQDFQSIRYFAIEELTGGDYARLEDQLATGEATGADGCAPESVSLDLEQPVSTVPVDACRLEPGEIEALQRELAVEEKAPFRQLVAELALELVLLERDETEQGEILGSLVAIADRLVADGELAELVGMQEHVDGIATMLFGNEPSIQGLSTGLTRALAERERLERFLEQVEACRAPKPEPLTVYLARLGPATCPALVQWMGRFSSPAYRRAATTAILFAEDGGLTALQGALPLESAPADAVERIRHRQFVRELTYALSRYPPEKALPELERLLGALDAETRRESFVAASRFSEPAVVTLCLERLADRDPEVRAVALDTLVRRGESGLGLPILEHSLENGGFDSRALNEKRRVLAAVAKLAGESALPPFRRLLFGRDDRWFASQRDREFAEAVAHGIRIVGTPASRRLLADFSQRGPKFARAACAKELEGGRGGAR